MIEVHTPLAVKPDLQDGWKLILWAGQAFDYDTPFRAMLAEVAHALGQDHANDLHLPAYEPNEDFISGTLQFGSGQLHVYYEHSLGYLALMNESDTVLRDVADRLRDSIRVA